MTVPRSLRIWHLEHSEPSMLFRLCRMHVITADQLPSTLTVRPLPVFYVISLACRSWGCFSAQFKSISWSPLPTHLKMSWLQLFTYLHFSSSLPLPWAICHRPTSWREGGDQRLPSLCQCQGQAMLCIKTCRK